MSTFSTDFAAVFSTVLEEALNSDPAWSQTRSNGEIQHRELSADYKEKRKLAKRIVKAAQPSLEDATKKEGEILRKPFEKELKHLDHLLELSMPSRRNSLSGSHLGDITQSAGPEEMQLVNGFSLGVAITNGEHQTSHKEAATVNGLGLHYDTTLITNNSAAITLGSRGGELNGTGTMKSDTPPLGLDQTPPTQGFDSHMNTSEANPGIQIQEPPTPPMSTGDDTQPLSTGGIPWYLETFDPDGTTIQEERWTGRDLVRGMSEELSDMGDEELSGLVDLEAAETTRGAGDEEDVAEADATEMAKAEARRKAALKRKRWRGFR